MLVMCTTSSSRIEARLAILVLILFLCTPTSTVGAGLFTLGLQELMLQDRDLVPREWQEALAELCTESIRMGESGEQITFKARPVTELLVRYDSSFDQLGDRWADRNEDLNYLVIPIPEDNVRGFLEQAERELLTIPGVRLIGPRCLPMRISGADEQSPCVKANKLAFASSPVEKVRDVAECGGETLDKNRVAIQLPELLGSAPGKTTLVSVIDTGFEDLHLLGPALAKASYNKDGSLLTQVNGWDYCKNSASVGDVSRHGTQISGLIAASCTVFRDAPGVSQSGLIFAMQVFYKDGSGHPGFAGPEALAEAIGDAVTMGSRVINMSFTISPKFEEQWTEVQTAIEKARKVVFVTGPRKSGELPFPGRLQPENMILVGARFWSNGALRKKTWGAELHIDAPWAANLVKTPSLSGASNAIAYVSGAVAELLGRCDSLSPKDVRDILINKGLLSSDSLAKRLLQVGFLSDPNCN